MLAPMEHSKGFRPANEHSSASNLLLIGEAVVRTPTVPYGGYSAQDTMLANLRTQLQFSSIPPPQTVYTLAMRAVKPNRPSKGAIPKGSARQCAIDPQKVSTTRISQHQKRAESNLRQEGSRTKLQMSLKRSSMRLPSMPSLVQRKVTCNNEPSSPST
ncbi:hypothetical protein R6Q59_006868 [Mikania micrantha]